MPIVVVIFFLLGVFIQFFCFFFTVGIAGPIIEDPDVPDSLSQFFEGLSLIMIWIAIWPSKILGVESFWGLGFKMNAVGWSFIGLIVGVLILQERKG